MKNFNDWLYFQENKDSNDVSKTHLVSKIAVEKLKERL